MGMMTLTLVSYAQIQKGAILTGGAFSFNKRKNETEFTLGNDISLVEFGRKSSFIAIRPQIGVFSSASTLLGIGISYEHSASERTVYFNGDPMIVSEKTNTYFINPYYTKFGQLTDKLYFRTSINFLIGLGSDKGKYLEGLETRSDVFEFRLNVTPGLTYFISEKWALSGSIGQLFYDRRQETLTTDLGGSEQPRNVDVNYGMSFSFNTFSFGFQYLLATGAAE